MKLIYILIFAPIFFSCAHNEVSVKKEFQPTLNLENYQIRIRCYNQKEPNTERPRKAE